MPAPRLFLIDGSNQMYRAYHAIRGLTGPNGASTNAIYGFVTMMRKLIADHAPTYVAAAFDLAGPTFRDDLVDNYKANRAPMPPDLVEQIALVHDACAAMGVPVLVHEGFEADDVIGTLARHAASEGLDVAIVTGDKDFFQLVDDRIRVFNPRDDGAWFDAEAVREKFGVRPAQVVDVLALMGDTIDNVKGVPGIGEKGARDLIATWGSLDALLAHAAEVPQKKYRDALLANADAAHQSRTLVTIRTDVPVSLDLEALRYTGPQRERCFELFGQLGFRSLVASFAPTAASVETDYAFVDTAGDLDALLDEVRAAQHVACAMIADEAGPMRSTPMAIVFSLRPRHARIVMLADAGPPAPPGGGLFDAPVPAATPPGVAADEAWARIGALCSDPGVTKTGHDLKALARELQVRGYALNGLIDDTLISSYVVDATRSSHALDDLALDLASYQAGREDDVRGKGMKTQGFRTIARDALRVYAGERADLAGQIAPVLGESLDREGLRAVYDDLELPLVPVLADLERTGIRVDTQILAAQASRIDAELATRSARIYALAGMEFNINSPKQLAEVLFDKLQLPVMKRTGKAKTPSTGVEVLEELAQVHEMPREVLEWRAMMKLKGTYIDALPLLIHPATRRVHTTYNQAVAATGRLSSSDPNLQNIPIRTELGREIRAAFVAEPGCVLISADYSQIELRVLAHIAHDQALIDAFTRDEDIHDQTALKVFGASSGLDPYELRRRAKIINYALLYGKTAFTLSKDIGVSQQAAQAFIDAYFAGYPGVQAVHRGDAGVSARNRPGAHGRGTPPARAGDHEPQRPDPSGRRTRRGEHAHPGHGSRHPEARDDRPPSRTRGLQPRWLVARADAAHGARRTRVRGAAGVCRRCRGAGEIADGGSRRTRRARHRGRRHRRELARGEVGAAPLRGPGHTGCPVARQSRAARGRGPYDAGVFTPRYGGEGAHFSLNDSHSASMAAAA